MKLSLKRKPFSEALQSLRPAVPTRDIKDVLKNVLITTDEEQATLMATDLEVGITIDIPCQGTAGIILLPYDRLSRMVNESVGEEFVIEEVDDKAKLSCGTARWSLPTADSSTWPTITPIEGEPTLKTYVASLREGIRRARKTLSNNKLTAEHGWQFGSVICESGNGKLVVTGTDRSGLSSFWMPCDPCKESACLLPVRAADGMINVLNGGEVEVWITNHSFLAKCDGATVYSRLMEGRIPPWTKIIPKEKPETKVRVMPDVLGSAIRRAAIASDENQAMVFNFGKVSGCRSGKSGLLGEEKIEILNVEGIDQELIIGYPQFLELLRCCQSDEELTISIINKDRPVIVTSSVANWTGMLAPMENPK